MKNVIAIVGRPNVGKSSLFNKLSDKRLSIVHDEPGITRDRLYNDIEWNEKKIKIIDTGGIEIEDRPFQQQIKLQAQIAMEESDSIIFVVDGREGVTHDDHFVADILRKSGVNVIIAANKMEGNYELDYSVYELGFPVLTISALHGTGVGDLLDIAIENMVYIEEVDSKLPKLTIIGRPNSGKSSLLNTLTNEERSIVSPISGTTRDSVNSFLSIHGQDYEIIDTAGINRKSRLVESVDHYALSRAFGSLERADIVLLVIDATRDISHFDARIAGYASEYNKPIIIIMNKWDLIPKNTMTMEQMRKKILKEFRFIDWAPIVFISALHANRIDKLMDNINMVYDNLQKRIKTSILNEMLLDIKTMQPAPSFHGGRLNMFFCRQVKARIPTFVFEVNNIYFLHFTYERYIQNQFRQYFGYEGVPIRLLFRNKKGRERKNDE